MTRRRRGGDIRRPDHRAVMGAVLAGLLSYMYSPPADWRGWGLLFIIALVGAAAGWVLGPRARENDR